jgi:hypothetical protein
VRWLKIVLFISGLAFLAYAFSNYFLPASFFVPSDAAGYATDAVKVIAAAYLFIAIIQLGSWKVTDRFALRLIAYASVVFMAAATAQAAMVGKGSSDPFHQYSIAFAAAWGAVTVLLAFLIYRERSEAA